MIDGRIIEIAIVNTYLSIMCLQTILKTSIQSTTIIINLEQYQYDQEEYIPWWGWDFSWISGYNQWIDQLPPEMW